ncbi:MAG TPA: diguanylate cyclase [Acidimicrobiales bacterium]|nr:diguanylate cyclase [Acidimicrobiales bacterium]
MQLGDFAVNPLLVASDRGEVLYANAAMTAFAGPQAVTGAMLADIDGSPVDLAGMARRALAGEVVPGADVRTSSGARIVVMSLPAPGYAREHAQLLAAERRWRAVFDSAPVCMLEIAFDGTIVAANTASTDLTGRALGDIVGRSIYDLVDRRQRKALGERITARASGVRAPGPGLEMRLRRPDGEERWARGRGSLLTVKGEPEGRILLHLSDVTAERAHRQAVEDARDQLAHEARHDPLTGLPNRRALLDRFSDIASQTSAAAGWAVLFVDLDGFKQVNDCFGHSAGDELLVVVARRILHSVRPGDTVARLGGDEFVVLARDVDADGARGIAERVSEAVRSPLSLRDEVVAVTCSIGIAIGKAQIDASLVDVADAALYQAKEGGRARWCLAGPHEVASPCR